MLSHNNITQTVMKASADPEVLTSSDYRVLSFLPVCHIFERMLHYLTCTSSQHLLRNLGRSRTWPTANPRSSRPFRVLEKFYDGIVQGRAAGGTKAAIFSGPWTSRCSGAT